MTQGGYIYMVVAASPRIGAPINIFKIGCSRNVRSRYRYIRDAYVKVDPILPFQLKGVRVWRCDPAKMKDIEAFIHNKFSHVRMGGEWFALAEDDLKSLVAGTSLNVPWSTKEEEFSQSVTKKSNTQILKVREIPIQLVSLIKVAAIQSGKTMEAYVVAVLAKAHNFPQGKRNAKN